MAAAPIVLDKYLPIPDGMQFFTLKDDEVIYSCEGALSFGIFILEMSLGRTYRNELPASYMGTKWKNVIRAVKTADYTADWNEEGSVVGADSPPTQSLDSAVAALDDRATATPPHDTVLSITMLAFMDGATGAGNCIAMCPLSQFDTFSPAPPVRY